MLAYHPMQHVRCWVARGVVDRRQSHCADCGRSRAGAVGPQSVGLHSRCRFAVATSAYGERDACGSICQLVGVAMSVERHVSSARGLLAERIARGGRDRRRAGRYVLGCGWSTTKGRASRNSTGRRRVLAPAPEVRPVRALAIVTRVDDIDVTDRIACCRLDAGESQGREPGEHARNPWSVVLSLEDDAHAHPD